MKSPAGYRFWSRDRAGCWAEYIRLGYFWVNGRGYVRHLYVPPLIRNGEWIQSGYWLRTDKAWSRRSILKEGEQ